MAGSLVLTRLRVTEPELVIASANPEPPFPAKRGPFAALATALIAANECVTSVRLPRINLENPLRLARQLNLE
jgi:hypothetical protein